MPTENRSSNTEIVSVQAVHGLAEKVREALDRQACPNAWMVIAYEAVVANFPQPAEQPHPEPIAWMVGTAFWWTKEEGQRDAAETGLPVVPVGPMVDSAEVALLRCEVAKWRGTAGRLTHERDDVRAQLAQCETMAAMIAEREWAEHVGTGPVSSKVEAAFTQLHNDLHEAGEKLAERDALLDRVVDHAKFWHDHPYAEVVEAIAKDYKALSASAEPQVKS